MAKCYGSEVSADDKRLRERLIHQFSMTGLRRVAGQGRVGFRPSSEVQKFANGRWPAKSGLSAREGSFLRSCRSFVSAGLSSTAMQRDRLHRAATLGGIGLNAREDAAC